MRIPLNYWTSQPMSAHFILVLNSRTFHRLSKICPKQTLRHWTRQRIVPCLPLWTQLGLLKGKDFDAFYWSVSKDQQMWEHHSHWLGEFCSNLFMFAYIDYYDKWTPKQNDKENSCFQTASKLRCWNVLHRHLMKRNDKLKWCFYQTLFGEWFLLIVLWCFCRSMMQAAELFRTQAADIGIHFITLFGTNDQEETPLDEHLFHWISIQVWSNAVKTTLCLSRCFGFSLV